MMFLFDRNTMKWALLCALLFAVCDAIVAKTNLQRAKENASNCENTIRNGQKAQSERNLKLVNHFFKLAKMYEKVPAKPVLKKHKLLQKEFESMEKTIKELEGKVGRMKGPGRKAFKTRNVTRKNRSYAASYPKSTVYGRAKNARNNGQKFVHNYTNKIQRNYAMARTNYNQQLDKVNAVHEMMEELNPVDPAEVNKVVASLGINSGGNSSSGNTSGKSGRRYMYSKVYDSGKYGQADMYYKAALISKDVSLKTKNLELALSAYKIAKEEKSVYDNPTKTKTCNRRIQYIENTIWKLRKNPQAVLAEHAKAWKTRQDKAARENRRQRRSAMKIERGSIKQLQNEIAASKKAREAAKAKNIRGIQNQLNNRPKPVSQNQSSYKPAYMQLPKGLEYPSQQRLNQIDTFCNNANRDFNSVMGKADGLFPKIENAGNYLSDRMYAATAVPGQEQAVQNLLNNAGKEVFGSKSKYDDVVRRTYSPKISNEQEVNYLLMDEVWKNCGSC